MGHRHEPIVRDALSEIPVALRLRTRTAVDEMHPLRAYERRRSQCPRCEHRGHAYAVEFLERHIIVTYHCSACRYEWAHQRKGPATAVRAVVFQDSEAR